jgi:3-oxoacyl-[acyl-carrier-protein] synthase III
MAIEAAGRALAHAGLPADTVWRGIFVHSVHRRLHYPTVAQRIQHRHGLNVVNGLAEDCSSACAGYVQQVQKISDLMQVKPGAYLVVGGDCMSRMTPPDDINYDLFGDAAGATVWVPGENGQPGSIVATHSMLVTRGHNGDIDPITFVFESPHGQLLMPAGPQIVKWGRRYVFKVMEALLEKAGWHGGPPLIVIPHQANINLLKFFPGQLSRVYDGDVQVYSGMTTMGNSGSGSTAYGYAACLDGEENGAGGALRIDPGDRVLLVGFGSGMNIHGIAIQH